MRGSVRLLLLVCAITVLLARLLPSFLLCALHPPAPLCFILSSFSASVLTCARFPHLFGDNQLPHLFSSVLCPPLISRRSSCRAYFFLPYFFRGCLAFFDWRAGLYWAYYPHITHAFTIMLHLHLHLHPYPHTYPYPHRIIYPILLLILSFF